MGKQVGPTYITGTFGGVSFYVSEGQHLVRMAGGPTKKQIMSSPRFARTRENISEFGHCSHVSALLRKTLRFVLKGGDKYAYQRLTRRLTEIKNRDTQSARGRRNVGLALKHTAARSLLCGFEFNAQQHFRDVFLKPVVVTSKKEMCVANFDPGTDLLFPPGATHLLLKGARMLLDFEKGQTQIMPYEELLIDRKGGVGQLLLKPMQSLDGKGNTLYFIQAGFCTLDKGMPVPFSADSTALCLIAADPVLIEKMKPCVRPPKFRIIRVKFRNRRAKQVIASEFNTERLNRCADDG